MGARRPLPLRGAELAQMYCPQDYGPFRPFGWGSAIWITVMDEAWNEFSTLERRLEMYSDIKQHDDVSKF